MRPRNSLYEPRNNPRSESVSPAMNGYRDIALTALQTTLFVALAAVLILVVLPIALSAQGAVH